MANKHNNYFNKQSTKANLGSKTDIKKKKKFTFYLIIFLMTFCVIGSIFGSFAFVENRFASASTNPLDTVLDFNNSAFTSVHGSGQGYYDIPTGVTTNIGLTDYKNVGWTGFDSTKNQLTIWQGFEDIPNFIEFSSYNYLDIQEIKPFVTFNDLAYIAPNTNYAITFDFLIANVNYTLEKFEFYFNGGRKIDILEEVNTSISLSNDWKRCTFIFSNNTSETLTFSSYRFDIKFSTPNYYQFYLSRVSISQGSFTDGYNKGFQDGKQEGIQEGIVIGKEEGFQEGLEKNNSFYSLFSAIIDVPIKAFTSLFNFEIFGQNLTNFFLALITFAVVIKIVQLLL